MKDFQIMERVVTTIEADNAQDALDRWLNAGEEVAKYVAVEEREVWDADGNPCEVEEP